MYKLTSIVLLVSVVYYTQCLPAQSSDAVSKSDTGEKLQLFVNNGSTGVNYHLTPVFDDLDTEDQQLTADLTAVMPFLNFLLGSVNGNGIDDCLDQLQIQLIRDF